MAPRAQGADPRTVLLFRYLPSVFGTLLGIAVFIYLLDVLGLRFLAPTAVTSATEVLTQTYCSSGLFQWLACWAQNPKVLYFVMGCSVTSVLSSRRRRGAKPLAVAAAAIEKTLRRRCSRLLRQRQGFEWSNSLQRCCGRPLCFIIGHLQQQHGGPHEEVEEQCDRWSGLQFQQVCFFFSESTFTTSCTVIASLTRGLCVLRMFGQSRLFDGGFQQIATTAIVPFNSVL